MKILLLIHNQIQTGPYYKVEEMALTISSLGHSVDLCCTSKTNRVAIDIERKNGIRIISFPDFFVGRLRQGIDLWNTFRRIFFIFRNNYDVIHVIDCRPAVIIPALLLKKLRHIPLVISWWDQFGRGGTALERSGKFYAITLGKIETFFEEYFRKYADYSTVASNNLRDKLKKLGIPNNKIELLRIGATKYNVHINIEEVKKSIKISSNEKVLIYIGTLFQSDKTFLLESLSCFKRNYQILPKTILIGNHSLDKKLCNELNITITGWVENSTLKNYLLVADFGILPFKNSVANNMRWPSKVSEYFSYALPVIITPIGDFPKLFEKFTLGVMSSNDLPSQFSQAIYSAISFDDMQRKELSNTVSHFFHLELDNKFISKSYCEIYHRLTL